MKKMDKDKYFNLAIALIFLALVVGALFFYQDRVQECTSNPLPFSAKLYEERLDIKEATGTLTLWPNDPSKEVRDLHPPYDVLP
jgi:hypothetical protein